MEGEVPLASGRRPHPASGGHPLLVLPPGHLVVAACVWGQDLNSTPTSPCLHIPSIFAQTRGGGGSLASFFCCAEYPILYFYSQFR